MSLDRAYQKIIDSRKVLFGQPTNTNQVEYVDFYDKIWADSYDEDGYCLGFHSWSYAEEMIKKFVPKKDSLILDYCAGTGQMGKRLASIGYTNLHNIDGSENMQKKAKALGVYSKFVTEVFHRGRKSQYLNGEFKYDVVLSCMSQATFESFVQQVFEYVLKPGGIFVAVENVPNIKLGCLNGIPWALEQAKNRDSGIELLEETEEKPYDDITKHPTKVVALRKKMLK